METAAFYFFLVLSFLAGAVNLLFYNTLSKLFRRKTHYHHDKIKFSIIVPVKNEYETVPELIRSIEKNNYPNNLFELIIVDDNSDDDTFLTINKLNDNFNNLKLYRIDKKIFPAKKGVLAFGISHAENQYIIITDGDCKVDRNWIQSYNEKFRDGYDFIFGAAPFYQQKGIINKISCYENLRSSILTFTAAYLGVPFSASGRNFGFRRDSFLKIGGYNNTLDSLGGDDDLLLREAITNKMKIGFITDKNSAVFSYTKTKLKDYLDQKSRHTKTSFHYLPSRKIMLAFFHLSNLIILFSVLLFFLSSGFLIPFFIKILSDAFLVINIQRKFHYKFRYYEIIILQIIYEFFLIINFFNSSFRKEIWKYNH